MAGRSTPRSPTWSDRRERNDGRPQGLCVYAQLYAHSPRTPAAPAPELRPCANHWAGRTDARPEHVGGDMARPMHEDAPGHVPARTSRTRRAASHAARGIAPPGRPSHGETPFCAPLPAPRRRGSEIGRPGRSLTSMAADQKRFPGRELRSCHSKRATPPRRLTSPGDPSGAAGGRKPSSDPLFQLHLPDTTTHPYFYL